MDLDPDAVQRELQAVELASAEVRVALALWPRGCASCKLSYR
jgi:hypothetical protein